MVTPVLVRARHDSRRIVLIRAASADRFVDSSLGLENAGCLPSHSDCSSGFYCSFVNVSFQFPLSKYIFGYRGISGGGRRIRCDREAFGERECDAICDAIKDTNSE